MKRTILFFILILNSCTSVRVKKEENKVPSNSSNMTEILPNFTLKSGKYLGYLSMKERSDSLPFVIELVSVRNNKNLKKFRSVVKILHGNFLSHEYTSEYFPHVDFQEKSGEVHFKQRNNRFNLINVNIHKKIITGKFSSNPGIEDGTFVVELYENHNTPLLAETPVAKNLTGAYTQQCSDKNKEIQIEVFRNFDSQSSSYSDWELSGRIGTSSSKNCNQINKNCGPSEFTNINYDFFAGTIQFNNKSANYICQITPEGLQCEDCLFKRNQQSHLAKIAPSLKYKTKQRKSNIHLFPEEQLTSDRKLKSIKGIYYGYLHHERDDKYQLVRVNIESKTAKTKSGETWQFLTGYATTFFGKEKYNEFITYQFQPRRYVKSRPVMTLDGNGEIFIIIDKWKSKSISAIYYSKNFGRVGTLQLVKGRVPSLNDNIKIFPQLTGEYINEYEKLKLVAEPNKSNSHRDFFPLKVYGWALNNSIQKTRLAVTEGAFDFYTDTISLKVEDGRRIFGKFTSNSTKFYWPNSSVIPNKKLLSHRTKRYLKRDLPSPQVVVDSFRKHIKNNAVGKNVNSEELKKETPKSQ